MSSYERNTILSHLPGTLKVFGDLLIHFFLILSHFSFLAASNLHVSPKTEIYLDFSIQNCAEICDFSVLTYNFYSFNLGQSH